MVSLDKRHRKFVSALCRIKYAIAVLVYYEFWSKKFLICNGSPFGLHLAAFVLIRRTCYYARPRKYLKVLSLIVPLTSGKATLSTGSGPAVLLTCETFLPNYMIGQDLAVLKYHIGIVMVCTLGRAGIFFFYETKVY